MGTRQRREGRGSIAPKRIIGPPWKTWLGETRSTKKTPSQAKPSQAKPSFKRCATSRVLGAGDADRRLLRR